MEDCALCPSATSLSSEQNESDITPTSSSQFGFSEIPPKELKLLPRDSMFQKFEYFGLQPETSFTVDDAKAKLHESICCWKEFLNMAGDANETNQREFGERRYLLTQIFFDTLVQDSLNKDNEFARQIFFEYLDTLNRSDLHDFLMKLSWKSYTDKVRGVSICILISFVNGLCGNVVFIDNDLSEKYASLFNAIRILIDRQVHDDASSSQNTEASEELCSVLLNFLWNITDATVLVPFFLDIGLGKSALDWLQILMSTKTELESTINIIHNLSRHDRGVDELNKHDAIEILKHWQSNAKDMEWTYSLLITMALAHLCTSEQIKTDPSGTMIILDQLLQTTIDASKAERFRFSGFHVSEPLCVLVKLFVNDSIIDYVMNKAKTEPPSNTASTICLFSDLLVRFYGPLSEKNRLEQFTLIALCNIIWSISFQTAYQNDLKQHKDLIKTIQTIAEDRHSLTIDQYVPRSMLSVKKAADGILFNLHLESDSSSVSSSAPVIAKEKPLVMISYCHADSEFCDRLLLVLDKKVDLFDVWIDRRFCKSTDDVWESIAKGIKNAQLIICMVSTEYVASKSCRQEIIYAKDRLNKRFLPIYIEKPEVSDWLDIRLAEFKYVRFQNVKNELNQKKVEEFITTLIESILPGQEKTSETSVQHSHFSFPKVQQKPTTGVPQRSTSNKPPVAETQLESKEPKTSIWHWTQVDIENWFEEQQISSEIRDLYQFKTGAQMMTYAECLSNDSWMKQYERYARRYAQRHAGEDLLEHDFAHFASALQELSDHHRSVTKKTPAKNDKRSSCVIL